MNQNTLPRLGVLALMLEGYEPLFPGITAGHRLAGGHRRVRVPQSGAEPGRH